MRHAESCVMQYVWKVASFVCVMLLCSVVYKVLEVMVFVRSSPGGRPGPSHPVASAECTEILAPKQ